MTTAPLTAEQLKAIVGEPAWWWPPRMVFIAYEWWAGLEGSRAHISSDYAALLFEAAAMRAIIEDWGSFEIERVHRESGWLYRFLRTKRSYSEPGHSLLEALVAAVRTLEPPNG